MKINPFLVIVLFYILDIAHAISRKVYVLEAQNVYQLIDYLVKIKKNSL